MFNIFSWTYIIISILAAVKCDCNLRNFRKDKIVPDIVPVLPKQPLEVIFSNNKSVTCGETVSSSLTLFPPDINFQADDGKYYALIMFNMDRPSPVLPVLSNALEWMTVNIPGNNLEKGELQRIYTPPLPLSSTSCHRIVFLVLQQSTFLENYTYTGLRDRFRLKKWMAEAGITEITAGNYVCVSSQLDEMFASMLEKQFDELRDNN